MNEYEVLNKINEAIAALDDYNSHLYERKGIWHNDIKKVLPLLVERSFALGASGTTCPRCNGTGRI